MSIKDGGPAFPIETTATPYAPGMTLRDWFAGQAVAGLSACALPRGSVAIRHYASTAYEMADAMIASREAAQ